MGGRKGEGDVNKNELCTSRREMQFVLNYYQQGRGELATGNNMTKYTASSWLRAKSGQLHKI